MSNPKQGKKAVSAVAASKAKGYKTIPGTLDLLRRNGGPKRDGKGKERAVLGGLGDLVKMSDLPGAVQVERFAETRAMEIVAMQRAVKMAAGQNATRAFQSLPRHLRRRAASHNPRRVPKRIRAWAASEVDPSSTIAKQQRKKAKRRARGNLRGESRTVQLRRRQLDKRWLGTHLYHAKRFHMVNVWGYRLASTPTLKSFRASYRAARRKATLHDASYFGTIEVEGEYDALVSLLGSITAGGAVAGDKYESGCRVASTYAYQPGAFPLGMIGPVEVLWQRKGVSDTSRRLWLRSHPSIFDNVLQAVEGAAQTISSSRVVVRNLCDELEAFEIMGPQSGAILRRVLRFCHSEGNAHAVESLLQHDPAQCPDGVVASFTVYDPRLSFPPTKAAPHGGSESVDDSIKAFANDSTSSGLWSAGVRAKLRHPKFKKSDLDYRRHEFGLPGSRLHAIAQDDRIPMILVKRTVPCGNPGEESLAFHGYTLLFPRGWSMALLPSFVYCNVKLGGFIERRVQYREAGTPSFPEHFGSVCAAGALWEDEQAATAERLWLRKPPGKRPEYSILGTKWPFQPDWNAVLLNVSEEEAEAHGHGRVQPWLFNTALAPFIGNLVKETDSVARCLLRAVNVFRRRRALDAIPPQMSNELLSSAVCHVQVNMLGRGSPFDMAVIYAVGSDERAAWVRALENDREGLGFEGDARELLKLGEADNACKEIGFVTTGNISLSRGEGHALATVSLKGYLDLIAAGTSATDMSGMAVAKVRNIDGHVCRLAVLSLVQ